MATRLALRRDKTVNWTEANPVLAMGEPGYDEDNNDFKIGDGLTAWLDLPTIAMEGPPGPQGATGDVTPAAVQAVVDAQAASALAQEAATNAASTAAAIPATNDPIVANLIGDDASQTKAALSDTIVAVGGDRFASAYTAKQAQQYKTTADGASLLEHVQPTRFAPIAEPGYHPVVVRRDVRGQKMLGYGASISDAAAWTLLNHLTAEQRTALLEELYGPTCGWTMTRISFGSTGSFNTTGTRYTYDDTGSASVSDMNLDNFSIAPDTARVIPVLKEMLRIQPQLRVHVSLSTLPSWMTQTGGIGNLFTTTVPESSVVLHGVEESYAQYLVKAVQAFEALGIPIYSLSPFNEPFYTGTFSPTLLSDLIADHIGPAFRAANLRTKILVGEDQFSFADQTKTILDSRAAEYVDGSSWHAYVGQPWQMAAVQVAHPDKTMHMTEMRNLLAESYGTKMNVMLGRVIIGATHGGAASLILWNLALDETGEPSSGATGRQGVITVPSDGGGAITRNPQYYALNHISRFVKTGAQRIGSDSWSSGQYGTDVQSAAFENPDGSVVLIVYNPTSTTKIFNIIDGDTMQGFPLWLTGYEVSTFVWGTLAQDAPLGAEFSPVGVPSKPTLTVAAENGQAGLTWPSPSSTAPVASFSVFRGATAGSEILLVTLPATARSYKDPVAAGSYSYRLQAVSTAGPSVLSDSAAVTVAALAAPTKPATPTTTVVGNQVLLAWTNLDTDSISSIEVYRASSSTGAKTKIGTVGARSTVYSDIPPVGPTYYYSIKAWNAAGEAYSDQVTGQVTAAMAKPAVDAVTTQYGRQVSRMSWLHTIGDIINPAVVVTVHSSGTGIPAGASYGGVPMTLLKTGKAGTRSLAIYGLQTPPPLGVSEVVVDVATRQGSYTVANCVSLANVYPDNPFGTAGLENETGVTSGVVTTTAGTANDLVIAAACSDKTITVASPQTATTSTLAGATHASVTTQDGGTADVTTTFTLSASGTSVVIAVPVHAAIN